MPRWVLRGCLLLVASALLFAWIPDIDLGDGWGAGRALSAPEARPHAEDAGTGCHRPEIDTTPEPGTDITAFRAGRSGNGLVLVASFHDLLPDVQQDVEFDLRTSRGRDLNVDVQRSRRGGPVEVMIGEAPDPVQAAAMAADCTSAATLVEVGGCRGLTGRMDARADVVTVRVPRQCLGNPRWVRAGVSSVRYVDPSASPQDVWLPPGGDPRSSFGPLGPWVSIAR